LLPHKVLKEILIFFLPFTFSVDKLNGMSSCYSCKKEIDSSMTIGQSTVCPHCGKPLKTCLNCRFYDVNAYHQCKESVEELIRDKDRANFCPQFMINRNIPGVVAGNKNKEEAIKRLKALFNED